MIGRTNVGGSSAFAVIDVTYPEGAVCTCTNGVRTMQAKDTSGRWMFQIPRAGEWTVTAENEGASKSETVNATESKAYSLELNFIKYLFKNGEVVEWATLNEGKVPNGVTIGSTAIVFSSNHSYRAAYTKEKQDLTKYKTLRLRGSCSVYSTDENNNPRLMISNTPVSGPSWGVASTVIKAGSVDLSLDITNFNSSYYIEINGAAVGSFTEVFLEPK